jgi:methyltransferase (TIGR00027 family)
MKDAAGRGLRTVVILGAGLDTRAYRLPELASCRVFEVDLPAIQAFKRSRLMGKEANVRFVPIDFNGNPLDEALARGGLDPKEPAIFLWEGVTQYLQPEAVDAVLRTIAARPRGSEVVFTYVRAEAIGDKTFRPEPWYFGIEPSQLEAFLRERGLELLDDCGAEEHTARYLRPVGRELEVSPIERVARAVVS